MSPLQIGQRTSFTFFASTFSKSNFSPLMVPSSALSKVMQASNFFPDFDLKPRIVEVLPFSNSSFTCASFKSLSAIFPIEKSQPSGVFGLRFAHTYPKETTRISPPHFGQKASFTFFISTCSKSNFVVYFPVSSFSSTTQASNFLPLFPLKPRMVEVIPFVKSSFTCAGFKSFSAILPIAKVQLPSTFRFRCSQAYPNGVFTIALPQAGHFTSSIISGLFSEKSKLIETFPSSSFCKTRAPLNFFLFLETKPFITSVRPFVMSALNSSSLKSRPATVPIENLQPVPSFL